jgi:hypothetical protein
MSEILQPGQHPDADQLSAFIEHALPAHEYQQTLAHLADCPDCRSVVSLSLPPVDESPILQAKEVRRSWFGGWNLAWPAAAAACAALAVFFVVRIHQTAAHRPSASTAAQMAESHAPAPAAVAGQSLSAVEGPSVFDSNHHDATRARSSAALPPAGRNLPGLTKLRPAPSNAPTVATASAAANASASQTVEVHNGSGVALSLIRNDLRLLDQAESTVERHPLPSGLPALSMVSAGQRILVIDTHNTVFFSEDSGDHWKAIPSPWKGRAVKVELASSTIPPRPISTTLNGKPGYGVISGMAGEIVGPPKNASVTGTVKDPTGAVIPGASVVVSAATNVSGPVKTDSDGRYVVNDLAPGSYEVEVRAPGFETQQTPVTLVASQQASVNFLLSVGQASQTVTVNGAVSPVDLSAAGTMSAKPSSPIRFEITTDTGELWTSSDGQIWTHR